MLNLFKKKAPLSPPLVVSMRDTLFGDASMDAWPPATADSQHEPWASFARARDARRRGDEIAAVGELQGIVATPDLESRHYVQAWQFLRELGVQPEPGDAHRVLGVIIEVGMPTAFDLLAAYADRSARYWNYSGAGVVWEASDSSLDAKVLRVVSEGQALAVKIGPWDKERPGPVANGIVRINMLTPSGLHFGQGPMDDLSHDPMGAPTIAAGVALMQALMEKSPNSKRG